MLTRSSPGVYHDYSMPPRYYRVKTYTCTPPPAIRAKVTLDHHGVLHFPTGEHREVASIIVWTPERAGAALAWSTQDGEVGPA